MEEFTQSVKATLYERAKKPFTGTFILAWIAFNWKLLVSIFFINEEHLDGITRIDYIEGLQLLGINNLVVKPFGVAIAAIFLLGILNVFASWVVLQFKNFQFTYVEKRTKVDSADYGKLLDELRGIKDKWADEIKLINFDRTQLMASNQDYESLNHSLEREIKSLKDRLSVAENQAISRKTYKKSLVQAFDILSEYQQKHGLIKRDRTVANSINASSKPTQIEDILKSVEQQYKHYND